MGVWGGEQKSTWADLENQKPVFFQHPSLSLTSVVLSRLPASWSGNLKNHGLPAPRVHREALRPGGASRAAQHPGTGAGGGRGAGIRLHGRPRWSQTCDGSLSSGRHRAGHSTCLSLVLTTGRALLRNRHITEWRGPWTRDSCLLLRLLSKEDAAGPWVPVSPHPRDLSGRDRGRRPNPRGRGKALAFVPSSLPARASHLHRTCLPQAVLWLPPGATLSAYWAWRFTSAPLPRGSGAAVTLALLTVRVLLQAGEPLFAHVHRALPACRALVSAGPLPAAPALATTPKQPKARPSSVVRLGSSCRSKNVSQM